MEQTGSTVSIAFVRVLLRMFDDRRAQQLIDELGITASQLADDGARVPREISSRAWRLAPELSGDPLFGLHLAERVPFGAFGVVEIFARSSRTLREGMTRLVQYYSRLDGREALAIETTAGRLVVAYQLEQPNHHVTECAIAMIARAVRELWSSLRPPEVELTGNARAPLAEYERVLGVVPRFGAATPRISFDSTELERVVPAADRQAMAVIGSDDDEVMTRVRRAIEELLPLDRCSADEVGKRVGVSDRTLRRRLADAGTTFSDLVTSTRRTLAERHLGDERLSVQEVATMVGFSDQRAFARAFRRWTGSAPLEYRARLRR
jgi:AraC-like DNA-binding protein